MAANAFGGATKRCANGVAAVGASMATWKGRITRRSSRNGNGSATAGQCPAQAQRALVKLSRRASQNNRTYLLAPGAERVVKRALARYALFDREQRALPGIVDNRNIEPRPLFQQGDVAREINL